MFSSSLLPVAAHFRSLTALGLAVERPRVVLGGEAGQAATICAARFRFATFDSLPWLAELRKKGIAAGIYTQTSDVEGEINGILTYDRRVQKATAESLAEIHRKAGF